MSRRGKSGNESGKESEDDQDDAAPAGKVRLDKWLWAARFFKTRALAQEAIDGGKVDVNGERAKRSKLIQASDRVQLRQGPQEWQLVVRDVASRRGSAQIAQGLYVEDEAGRARRELIREELRRHPTAFAFGDGKPGKRDRRELRKLKGN